MNPTGFSLWAARALEILEQNGFEAWCVGGCVRDTLLGSVPEDWDIATNALPEETKACFQSFRTVDIGIRHGTVTVLLDGHPVEITTYRSDGDYADHRHPDKVRFSRLLEDDLSRRDFTVNAMACHPDRGLRDPFGGLADLHRQVLRCVGDPKKRFDEDALRILRCLRFSSTLGFSIDPDTESALFAKKDLLPAISQERVREELTKLLCGKNAEAVLRKYSQVIFTVLPELSPMEGCLQENPYHCYDVWEHTLRVITAAPPFPELRWAALLHDCGKPGVKTYGEDGTAHFYSHEKRSAELAETILENLLFSNHERETILTLVKLHGEIHPISEKRVKKLLGKLGKVMFFQLLELSKADLLGQAPYLHKERGAAIEKSRALAEDILAREDCLTLRDLAVNGNDLLALGYEKGPSLGKALNGLLEKVLEGKLANEKEILLQEAKSGL